MNQRAVIIVLAAILRLEALASIGLLRITPGHGGGTGSGTQTTHKNVPNADTAPAATGTMILASPNEWCGKNIRMPMETGFEKLVCCLIVGHDGVHYDDAFFKCWKDPEYDS